MKQLKYWRSLSKKEKEIIKSKHGIKTVSFEFICRMFEKIV